MKQAVVQIRNLTKTIGGKTIIDDLSFDVYSGEVFGFLGPNGAGKTTTIRMLFGLISMTEGEILIKGSSIKENYEVAAANIGGIVENPEMYKFLTGYQNLVHYARMHEGIGKKRIDELVQVVGLGDKIHDKVKTYSLGMKQRLGLAQALLHSPSVVVLDEPTNGLDPAGIREMRDYLRKIAAEENVAVFVSSHLLSEMEIMCDRIGIIQNGKLIDIKTIRDLLDPDNGKMPVTFTVEPVAKAVDIISSMNFSERPEVFHDEIKLILEREEIPRVTLRLSVEGIKIYGINPGTQSLEDKFLDLTGGNGTEQNA